MRSKVKHLATEATPPLHWLGNGIGRYAVEGEQ
jgi:hypothetical protein